MEERAVLANIATIITKDLLIDEPSSRSSNASFFSTNYPLLEASDDEAEIFALMQQKRVPAKGKLKRSHFVEPAMAARASSKVAKLEWKYSELNLLHRYVDAQFESYLHMRKLTYLKIQQSLEGMLLRHAVPGSPAPQTTFSLALWKLATDEHFEEIARKFQFPWSLCQQVVRSFWHIISDNYESFIKWPNSLEAQQNTLQGFQSVPQLSCFHELFGIISLKRLDIFLECEHAEVAVVLQLICNAERKIIDCYVELEQEYSFEESPIGQTLALNPRTMPAGSYLIGSNSFPLKSYLVRPIEAECFRKDIVFNGLLEPAFQLADNVNDTLARRFHTLYALEARDLNEVRLVVESICALHNLCVDFLDNYLGTDVSDQNKFNWGGELPVRRGSEKDIKGLRRRMELLDALVKTDDGE
ncbi:GH14470 [Drosophila grimshawi]|uniref:GH14470 n=2 Tax=Drosophila grimshawi TaxID=7222 RepID=B4J048_DROGR|nr:GH14470 [Drosophila grimshawi]